MTDTLRLSVDASPSARRFRTPNWFNLHLVSGAVLVLAAVTAGALVVSAADHRASRWVLTRDLAAGTVLSASDIRPGRVQLGVADGAYVPVTEAVVGRAVQVSVHRGQLLPRAALGTPDAGVAVSVPLRADNGPEIARGDRLTLWLSTKSCQAAVLLSGTPVQSVSRSPDSAFGSDQGSVLVVTVAPDEATRLMAALDLEGAVIRAGVLSPGQAPARVTADLSSCAGTPG